MSSRTVPTYVIALLVPLIGCSEVTTPATDATIAPPTDAATDGAVIDAPSGRCDPGSPFGAPTLVAGIDLNTSADEYNAQLSDDELAMYFVRNPGAIGGTDIYLATRASADDGFGAPVPLAGVNNAERYEFHPTVSDDGRALYFTASTTASWGDNDVYVATRTTTVVPFGFPMRVATTSSADDERGLYLIDGVALWFSRIAGGDEDVYRATITSTGLGTPELVPGLNTPEQEGVPVVASDELTVYFTSGRLGGNSQVFVATRASRAQPFGAPSLVFAGEVPSAEPSWLSADGCVLYLNSHSAGTHDLYVARRSP